jgi:ABC-type branched-subunit amino acid transport system ATPase component/ABC-type branched-subunit amino acid transport system permease subunit
VSVPIDVVVLGLVTGLTYSMLGVGLVLTYKSGRVINFAIGEMGALAAIVLPILIINRGWPYGAALVVALLVAVATGGVMELVMRAVGRSSRLIAMVATIGASQLFFTVNALVPKKGQLGRAAYPTPFHAALTIGHVRLGSGPLLALITVPLVTAALAAFLTRTNVGLASRAAAENHDAARLAGVPVRRVSLIIWVISGLLAAVAGILVGPTQPIVTRVAVGPQLLFRALAVAMLAGLSSLPQAFAGGLGIGVIEALVKWNKPTGGFLEVTLVVVIVLSLVARRDLGRRARGGEESSWSLAGTLRPLAQAVAQQARVRMARVAFVVGCVAFAVLIAIPASNGQRVLLSGTVLFAAMGLSVTVLTGFAGQVSLGQYAFVGLGAVVGGRLHQLGYPAWSALLYAVVAGGAVALLIGLPALRIRGLYLAAITLGFAVAAPAWMYGQHWLVQVQGAQTSLRLPRPHVLGANTASERNYYWLCLFVFIVLVVLVIGLRRSGVGRAMLAVRDNEAAAASMGISPRRTKLIAFVLAGMVAACAGYFYGGLLVTFTDPSAFAPELSVALLATVILGGVTTVSGAIAGALFVKGLAYFVGPLLPGLLGANVALLVSGVGLLAAVLQFPGGIAEVGFRLRDLVVRRLVSRERNDAVAVRSDGDEPRAAEQSRAYESAPPSLEARDIVVRYGGHVVLNRVSLTVSSGSVLGLVGPNGAGKTTLFDVLSGHHRTAGGVVLLGDLDITALPPERRVGLGIGRTFQQARLFGDMTLIEAVMVALERTDPAEVVPSLLHLPPSRRSERAKRARASELIDRLGLGASGETRVSDLSTGMRRVAEMACLLALDARVLLLDEPTAGIAQREVEAFRTVLLSVRDELEATVVLIEHDLPLVMGVADRVVVIAAGEVIADGPPAVIRNDPAVIAAYLGTDERVIARSGVAAVPGL